MKFFVDTADVDEIRKANDMGVICVREISLFTRDPKREHTLKIVSALREQTGCKIQLFSYEDEDVLRRELADSQILTNGTNLGMAGIVRVVSGSGR